MPEPSKSKIYVDSCAFIDLAKYEAKLRLGGSNQQHQERENDVWHLKRLLEAARANVVRILTSSITIAECAHVREANQAVPSPETQRFFSELLTSGRSGVSLVQPTRSILERARDLRWRHGFTFGAMDSIHVATALQMQCVELLTRDEKIHQARAKLAVMKLDISYPNDTSQLPGRFRQADFDERLGESSSE